MHAIDHFSNEKKDAPSLKLKELVAFVYRIGREIPAHDDNSCQPGETHANIMMRNTTTIIAHTKEVQMTSDADMVPPYDETKDED